MSSSLRMSGALGAVPRMRLSSGSDFLLRDRELPEPEDPDREPCLLSDAMPPRTIPTPSDARATSPGVTGVAGIN